MLVNNIVELVKDIKNTNFDQMNPTDQCNYAYSVIYTKNVDLIKTAIPYFPSDMLIDFLSLLCVNYDLIKPPPPKVTECDDPEQHYDFGCCCYEPDPPPFYPIFTEDKFVEALVSILSIVDPKYYFHILHNIKPYPEVEKLVYNKFLQSNELMLEYASNILKYNTNVISGKVKCTDDILLSYAKFKISCILDVDVNDILTPTDYDNVFDLVFIY